MGKRRVISVCVSAAVLVTMCFAGAGPAFAGEEAGLLMEQGNVWEETGTDTGDRTQIMPTGLFDGRTSAEMEERDMILEASETAPVLSANDEDLFTADTTKFQVSIPSNGYLTLTIIGMNSLNDEYVYTVQAKTKGFTDYIYFNSSRNVRQIGVKKGTYTFDTKSVANYYYVKTEFKSVKESKYGKKKSKAAAIKKKKTVKGLMITGEQKTHWYKMKNPKTQKVKLHFSTKLSETGRYGGIKVSFYKGSRLFGSRIIYDDYASYDLKPYNTNGQKLCRGTYHIKVEPYNKGTGYYTMKWK